MPIKPMAVVAALQLLVAGFIAAVVTADAQNAPQRLVVKSNETVEIGLVFYVSNCRSIMIGLPQVEILEGAPELTISIKEGPVLPRRLNCGAPVPGGKLMLVATDITDSREVKLTYRLKYKTKDGDRQTGNSYIVSLFP